MTNFFILLVKHPAFSAITGLAGFLIGNRLALYRDKRKEFNDVAIPISVALLKQIKILEEGNFVNANAFVSDDDFTLVQMHLSKRIAAKYKHDLAYYKDCEKTCGHWDIGGWKIDDLAKYINASYKLLSYVKKK